jgi:hypothetical protein
MTNKKELTENQREAYEKKIATLQAQVDQSRPTGRNVKTEGSIKAMLRTENGTEQEKTISFADGFPTLRPISGEDIIVYAQDFMDLATGKAESIKDFRFKRFAAKPELAKSYEQDLPLSKDDAIARLVHMAQIHSAMVKVV